MMKVIDDELLFILHFSMASDYRGTPFSSVSVLSPIQSATSGGYNVSAESVVVYATY